MTYLLLGCITLFSCIGDSGESGGFELLGELLSVWSDFIFSSFISGTSNIIGTFDLSALPATIACLNFNFGNIFAIPSPK